MSHLLARPSPLLVAAALASAAPLSGGCSDLSLPEDALIACTDDEHCPAPWVCRSQIGRCIDPALLDAPALALASPLALSPTVLSFDDGFSEARLTFALNRAPASLTLHFDDEPLPKDACQKDERDGGLAYECALSMRSFPDAAEGVHQVSLAAVDELGNPVSARGALQLDLTPPAVASDTVALRLVPPPSSTVPVVSAWTRGGVAEVQLAFSEPLGATPRVVASAGGASLAFENVSEIGLFHVFARELSDDDLDGALADGPLTLEVTAEDLVGNVSVTALALTLVLDSTPPAAPAVDDSDAVTYERVPWGRDASGGEAYGAVLGAAGAAEPGSVLLVTTSGAEGPEVGRALVDETGAFRVELLVPSEVPEVFVSAVDGAGNRSEARRVRDVSWTATLGGKVPGASFPNPHTFRVSSLFVPMRESRFALEPQAPSRLATRGALTTTAAGGHWRAHPSTSPAPPGAIRAATAADPVRGVIWHFGGRGSANGNTPDELWTWSGGRFGEVDVPAGPSAREGARMVFDAGRERLVLFGGTDLGVNSRILGDTWEYDGSGWRGPLEEGPPARARFGMAYDPLRRRTVVFGGATASFGEWLSDTWEYDGEAWVERALPSAPSPRAGHAMVWDAARQQIVLFGGLDEDGDALGDTWRYDGAAWTLVEGTGPPARFDHGMTYDATAKAVIVAGGDTCLTCGFSPALLEDVWRLHDEGWSELSDLSVPPHFGLVLEHDLDAGSLLVHGGSPSLPSAGDLSMSFHTFEIAHGAVLARRVGASQFTRIRDAAAAYDPLSDRVLADGGGIQSSPPAVNASTWAFAYEGWEVVTPSDALLHQYNHGMVATPLGVVMPGRPGEATRRWGGDQWAPLGPTPALDWGYGLAYDAARDRVVAFGGGYLSPSASTWEWDGATWTLASPLASPPARGGTAAVYDPEREVVVVFGGSVQEDFASPRIDLDDTWEFDGSTWHARTPSRSPPGRSGHRMSYDASRGAVVLYGGIAGSTYLGDVWVWTGEDWHEVEPLDAPPGRSTPVFVYDTRRDQHVLSNGQGAGPRTDTLTLDGLGKTRPSHLASFSFAYASAAPARALRGVRVLAVAAGRGHDGSDDVDGAALYAWDAGRWVEVAEAPYAPGAPGELTWEASDPAWLERLLVGMDRSLHLALSPRAPTGKGAAPATLESDYLEVTVRYRLP